MLYHGCLRSQRSAWPRCALWLRAPLWVWPKIPFCDGIDSRQQNCLHIAAQRDNGADMGGGHNRQQRGRGAPKRGKQALRRSSPPLVNLLVYAVFLLLCITRGHTTAAEAH